MARTIEELDLITANGEFGQKYPLTGIGSRRLDIERVVQCLARIVESERFTYKELQDFKSGAHNEELAEKVTMVVDATILLRRWVSCILSTMTWNNELTRLARRLRNTYAWYA